MADLAQRQAQQNQQLSANAAAAANQAALGVSGEGKSQAQYQQEKAQAYAGALQQSGGLPLPSQAPGNVGAAKSLGPAGGINYSKGLFENVGISEGGGAGLFGPNEQPPSAKKVNLSDTVGISEAIASEKAAIRQAQIQNTRPPAPTLLISGENTNPPIKRNSGGFADYFGAAPAPQPKGQAKSVNLFENVGISANQPPKAASVGGIPLFSGGQPQKGSGFIDVSSLDSGTINKVNSIVSNIKPGTDSVTVNINGVERTYPAQQALGGILADLNSARRDNPNQDISYGIKSTGYTTTTTRPPKAETLASREQLRSDIAQAGGAPISIFDVGTGKQVGSTQGPRATYDILKAAGQSDKGVNYLFSSTKQTPSSQGRIIDLSKEPYANLVEMGVEKPSNLGEKAQYYASVAERSAGEFPFFMANAVAGAANPEYVKNPPFGLGSKAPPTFFDNLFSFMPAAEKKLENVGAKAGIKIQEPSTTMGPSNILFSGLQQAGQELKENPKKVIAEAPGFLGSFILQAGGIKAGYKGVTAAEKGITKISNKINPPEQFTSPTTPARIAREGLREGSAEYTIRPVGSEIFKGEITTPKGVPKTTVQEFSQGTVAKSGNVSPEISKMHEYFTGSGPAKYTRINIGSKANPNYVGRLGNEYQRITPQLPSVANEIFGIGAKGEKVPTGRGNIKLPNPAGEVQPTVPLAFIERGYKVSAVREATPIPENEFLATNIKKEVADLWGLKPTGQPRTYSGKVTPQNKPLIQRALKEGDVIKPYQIFEYPYGDYLQNPKLYGELTRNPEGLASNMFSGKVTGPSITGYIEGKFTGSKAGKYTGSKANPKNVIQEFFTGKNPTNKPRSFSKGNFPIGDIDQGKVGAGASGKAQALTKERESNLRNYYGLGSAVKTKQSPTNYLGQSAALFPYQKGQGESPNIIAYPPGTQERFRQPKPTESTTSTFNQFFGQGSLLGNKQQNKQKVIPASDIFQLSKIDERQTQRYQSFLGFGQAQPQKGRQTTTTITRQNQETIPRQGQTNKQTTDTIFSYVTGQTTTTKTPTPSEGGGNIPKTPKVPPPTGGFGGLFFPGTRYGNQRRLPPGKRSYILYSTNPNQVGEFYTKGLPEQSVSSSPSIFIKGEQTIAKANRGRSTNPFGFTGGPIQRKSKSSSNKSRKSNSIFF